MDWVGDIIPTTESIAGSQILAHGEAHIKTITSRQAPILGCRLLITDDLEVPATVTSSFWSPRALLMRGFQVIRPSLPEEHPYRRVKNLEEWEEQAQPNSLPAHVSWGFSFIYNLAEKHIGTR